MCMHRGNVKKSAHVSSTAIFTLSEGLARSIKTSHTRTMDKIVPKSLRFLLDMDERVAIGITTRLHRIMPRITCSVSHTPRSEK